MANLDIQLTAMFGHQLVQVPTEVPLTVLIDGAFGQATHVAIPDTSVVCLFVCLVGVVVVVVVVAAVVVVVVVGGGGGGGGGAGCGCGSQCFCWGFVDV